MSKMKDSNVAWIGLIPINWDICRFKDHYKNVKEISGKHSVEYERLALTLNGVIKRNKDDSDGLQPKSFDTYQILGKNDFVFKMIDLQNISTSRVGLSPYTGLVSPAYLRFSPINEKWNTKYDYYFLISMYYNCVFNNLGGNGVRSALNSTDMGSFVIPNPNEEVKIKIVHFLDEKCLEIGRLISNQEKQIESLKAYKQSLITETVTKGLNPNVVMKDSGIEWIGDIPSDWEVHPVLFYFIERKVKNKLGEEQNLLSLSYGKIKQRDINQNDGLLPENFNTYNIIENQDIVLRLTDLQNDKKSLRTGLSTQHGIITSAYVTLKPIQNISSKYHHYLLHSYDIQKVFYNMGNGVRQGLTYTELSKLLLINPPINEQNKIVEYLENKCTEIEEIISEKQAQISTLESYKKSLIYEYVTGKKEVI